MAMQNPLSLDGEKGVVNSCHCPYSSQCVATNCSLDVDLLYGAACMLLKTIHAGM